MEIRTKLDTVVRFLDQEAGEATASDRVFANRRKAITHVMRAIPGVQILTAVLALEARTLENPNQVQMSARNLADAITAVLGFYPPAWLPLAGYHLTMAGKNCFDSLVHGVMHLLRDETRA